MRRIITVVVLLAVLNIYVAERVIARWPFAEHRWPIAWLCVLVFFLLQLVGPLGDRLWFVSLRQKRGMSFVVLAVDWISYTMFGMLSLLVFFTLVADVITVPWKLIAPPLSSSQFDFWTLKILGVVVGGTALVGLIQARLGPWIREVDIPIRGLPKSFNAFRIVQISDLHVGVTIRRNRVEALIRTVHHLHPDLVALTGDLVDGSVANLASEIAPVANLRAPHGVFFVTGNHEYFWNATEWIREFRRLGVRVLVNEHELIKRGNDSLILAGVTDYSTLALQPSLHASDPGRARAGAPAGLSSILLAHQPASYKMAHEAGFDLQLSGHTHAGQYFPFNLLVRFFQRYYKGLNRYGSMWVYVNRGTGYWGPPLRAGVPAEITLIRLQAGD